MGGGDGGGRGGGVRTRARSISATDENLKMLHLTALEYLLTLDKCNRTADSSTGCPEISTTFSSVLSKDGTFRRKVIRDARN